ncbi:hypothetical protein B0T24DRAFT_709939, partial [Lasiosphaeria ovina]
HARRGGGSSRESLALVPSRPRQACQKQLIIAMEFTLAVALVKVIKPVVDGCKAVNEKWNTYKNHGAAVMTARYRVNTQFHRFLEIGDRPLNDLDQTFNPQDEHHERTRTVIGLIHDFQTVFNECDTLITHFEEEHKKKKLQKKRPELPVIASGSDATTASGVTAAEGNNESDDAPPRKLQVPSITTTTLPGRGSSEDTKSRPSLSESSQTTAVTDTPSIAGSEDRLSSKKDPKRKRFSRFLNPFRRSPPKPNIAQVINPKGKQKADDEPSPSVSAVEVTVTPPAVPETTEKPASPASPVTPSKARADDVAHIRSAVEARLKPSEDPAAKQQDVQVKATVERHVEWMWKKSDLDKKIARLKAIMDDLDSETQLRNTAAGVRSAESAQDATKLGRIIRLTRAALDRLHRSLRAVNTAGTKFSLQLTEDFMAEGDRFFDLCQAYLSLGTRDQHFYFVMHRHDASNTDPQRSRLFVAQTKREFNPARDRVGGIAASHLAGHGLTQASQFARDAARSTSSRQFRLWGGVVVPSSREQLGNHWLFHEVNKHYVSAGTLAGALAEGTPAARMTVAQRIELALLLLYAYIYLADVRESCRAIGLECFRYYTEEQQQQTKQATTAAAATNPLFANPADPLILSPYISFGFGGPIDAGHSSAGGAAPIGSRRRQRPVDRSMLLLGVNLVQIALCVAYSGGLDSHNTNSGAQAGTVADEARRWAEGRLPAVDARVGVVFSEVAAECLRFVNDSLPGQQSENSGRQIDFLVDQVIRLDKMKKELGDGPAGAAVPEPVPLNAALVGDGDGDGTGERGGPS